MRNVTLAGMAMVALLGIGTPLFVVNATAQPKDIGEFCGYVRQLDSSPPLQAILNRTAAEQIVVVAEDPVTRQLVLTGFIQSQRIQLWYRTGTPNVITRVKLSRWFNDDCQELAPDKK